MAVIALTLIVLVNTPTTHRSNLPAQHATVQSPAAEGASASMLIGPRGSKVLTRAQLHEYVLRTFDDVGSTNAAAWEEQQWLAIGCMADAGFLWDPTLERAPHQTPAADGLTPSQQRQWQNALGGPGSTSSYNWRTESDWRNAGCIGRAVHATSQQDGVR
ncbi:hypothetical protein [Amnibacterium endophyticum]|uniref:Resuscitation-promoting factor core lysozyme-like domain-containing protein n=1 Tax=Amnibacterium endophyticum TaxID=2109337 RepID=A0ABW4LLD6_9MICO